MTADLDGLPFAIVRRGFDRAQVEQRLSKLLAERDSAHTARQNAVAERERISRELDVSRGETRGARAELAETRAEVDRLAGQVAELSTIPSTVDGMSDRLQQMVRVAQDEVNDMRSRATRGAAQILSMAQAEADELRESSRAERRTFEAEQRSAQDELHARLDETRTQLAALREESDGARARLDAEIAERRARDEQSLAAELADRREIMLADLATQERRQREEAQRIVDAASARARALVAEAAADTDRTRSQTREQVVRANEELEQLRALQHQVAEQLAGVRSLLDWTLPRINPTSAAPAGDATAAFPATSALETVPAVAPLAPVSPVSPVSTAASSTASSVPPAPPVAMVPEAPQLDTAEGVDGFAADEPDEHDSDGPPFGAADDAPLFGMSSRSVDDDDESDLDDPRAGSVADQQDPDPVRGAGIPQPREGDQAEITTRPSPVARSSHRAGARR
jgi:hypothetical protein